MEQVTALRSAVLFAFQFSGASRRIVSVGPHVSHAPLPRSRSGRTAVTLNSFSRRPGTHVVLLFLLFTLAGSAFGGEPRIDYLGHIEVPDIPWDVTAYSGGRHFGYSRGTFCYIPERDTFFLIGHSQKQLFAEISNPGPGKQATLLHDFVDLTQGQLAEHSRKNNCQVYIQSLLEDDGRIFLSAEKWYNVTNTAIGTHATLRADLDDPQFSGWWGVAGETGQATAFYMARLPERYTVDGRWLLTGGSLTWRPNSSPGPCALLVNPAEAQPGSRLSAEELLRYRLTSTRKNVLTPGRESDRGKPLYGGGAPGWLGHCNVGGVVAVGSRLIFFGRQALGYDYYGPSDEYHRLTGLTDPYEGKGYKSGPYEAAMWIYSLDGLRRGDASVIRIRFPWALSERGHADLAGACLHGDRIYVAEACAKWRGQQPVPAIHVLQIGNTDDVTVNQTSVGTSRLP